MKSLQKIGEQNTRPPSSSLALPRRVLCVFGVVLASTSFARIEETLAQAEHRYGKLVEQDEDWYRFKKVPFKVSLHFYHGKVDAIRYRKIEQHPDKPIDLSEKEIDALLSLNSGGAKWTRKFITSADPEWYAWEPKLHGIHFTAEHALLVLTDEFLERVKEAQTEEAKGELQGF